MAGIDTNQLRSAFVAEVTNGTTPSTPGFLTMHTPAVRNAGPTRSHQGSLVAGGALLGDTLLTNKSGLAIANAPLVYGLYDTLFETAETCHLWIVSSSSSNTETIRRTFCQVFHRINSYEI